MFGSIIIDTALGLVLTYAFLSLICMTINEAIAAGIALRATTLEKALVSMFNDRELVKKIYNSPIIFGLWQSNPTGKVEEKTGTISASEINDGKGPDDMNYSDMLRPPSYIPSKQIASVIIDMLKMDINIAVKDLEQMKEATSQLPQGPLKEALLSMAAHARGDAEKFRTELENWFDDAMDRVTGWYKREMQSIAFAVALVVAIICNADTFQIANSLYFDSAVRSALASSAVDYAKSQGQLSASGLPLGWANAAAYPANCLGWFGKGMGWLITALALTLGAPFWFDILNKFVNIRLAGKKPNNEKETGSKG